MLSDELIDEDIEALLYAQVYYGKSSEIEPSIDKEKVEDNSKNNTEERSGERLTSSNRYQKKRYFESVVPRAQAQGLKESEITSDAPLPQANDLEVTSPANHNNLSAADNQNSEQNSLYENPLIFPLLRKSQPFWDRIIINQYMYPPGFLYRLQKYPQVFGKSVTRCLKNLAEGRLSEEEFFIILQKKAKAKERFREKERLKAQEIRKAQEIICLSDSDNSDVEIVQVQKMPQGKVTVTTVDSESGGENEIIYVAPPPVPLINIDSESESEQVTISESDHAQNQNPNLQNSTQETSQHDIEDTSNDFLSTETQPKSVSDEFNFSLHGSEFQDTAFVKPANPADPYETESSTSTLEFNSRQFSNTVKTIVFSEVEFPRDDIFNDSNLESFGEFITPQKDNNNKQSEEIDESEGRTSFSKDKNNKSRTSMRTSSESSSESDYDQSESHKNLPDLTPMICDKSSPKPGNKNQSQRKKKKVSNEIGVTPKKPKSKILESDGAPDSSPIKENSNSKRKNDEDIYKKRSKRKKKKSEKVIDDEEGQIVASPLRKTSEEFDFVVTSSSTPKKPNRNLENLPDSSNKKGKKKRKGLKTNEPEVSEQETNIEEEQEVTAESTKKKSKKKKKNDDENGEKTVDQSNSHLEAENESIECTNKKKNKKRKKKDTRELEKELEDNNQVDGEKRTKKKKRKTTDEQNDNETENSVLAEEGAVEPGKIDYHEENSKRKGKQKRQKSSDSASCLENSESEAANQPKETETTQQNLDDSQKGEDNSANSGPNTEDSNPQEEDGDVIIIEQKIPVHTIESSDSEAEPDVITLDEPIEDMELVNISKDKEVELDDLDLQNILSKMTDDPDKWRILSADKFSLNIGKKRPRCNRCRQFGHYSIRCNNKPPLPVCSLCGGEGHAEPRCPNKICFTCGKEGNFSTVYCYKCVYQRKSMCSMCFLPGHVAASCPDLWRRYHLTTQEGPLVKPKKNCPTLKPRSRQWCSGCAGKGHLEFECDSYKWLREYPTSSPTIFKYKDVYESKKRNDSQNNLNQTQEPALETSQSNENIPEPSVSEPTVQQPLSEPVLQPPSPINPEITLEEISETTLPSFETSAEITEANESPAKEIIAEKCALQNESVVELLIDQPVPELNNCNAQQASQPVSAQATTSAPPSRSKPPRNQPMNKSRPNKPSSVRARTNTRRRRTSNDKSPRINPASVIPQQPQVYPYNQSVLNPFSLFNQPPPLFNQVPNNVLVDQLRNLANAVVNYHQNEWAAPNRNYYMDTSGYQIPPNPNPCFDPQPQVYENYEPCPGYGNAQDMFQNRAFLNMPFTITQDPAPNREVLLDCGSSQSNPQPVYTNYEPYHFSNRVVSYDYQPDSQDRFFIDTTPALDTNRDTPNSSRSSVNNDTNVVFFTNGSIRSLDIFALRKFKGAKPYEIRAFLGSKLNELQVTKSLKWYRSRMKLIETLKSDQNNASKRTQVHYLFKKINMYLFGVQKLKEGKNKLTALRNFVTNPDVTLTKAKRKVLQNAYMYIFGGEHRKFDYKKHLGMV